MNLLAFDSSTPVGSVALLAGDKLKAELTLSVQRTHSEHLMPAVAEVVASSGLSLQEVDALAVGTGPGSYTGIRIALGTAMGIGYALNLPIIGVSTLEVLAMTAWPAPDLIFSLLDAKRNEVYCGVYRSTPREPYLYQQGELEVMKVAELPRLLGKERACFVGPGSLLYQSEIRDLFGEQVYFGPGQLAYPHAAQLGVIARARLKEGKAVQAAELKPLYLRRPYVK